MQILDQQCHPSQQWSTSLRPGSMIGQRRLRMTLQHNRSSQRVGLDGEARRQQRHHDRALESLTIANSPCQNYLNGRRLSGESRLSRKYSNVKYFLWIRYESIITKAWKQISTKKYFEMVAGFRVKPPFKNIEMQKWKKVSKYWNGFRLSGEAPTPAQIYLRDSKHF